MSTVTVTLDRADAEAWLGYYREHRLTVWETRCRDALEDALDTKYGNHVSDPDLDNKPDIKLGDPTPDQESLPDEESAESDQRPSTDPCPYCGKDDCRTVEHWRDLADYWWRVAEEWADRTSDRLYEATQDRDCMEFITDRMGDRYPVRGIVMALLDWLVIHDEQGTGRAFGRWEVRDKTSDGGAGSGNGPEGRLTTVLTSPDRQGGEGPVEEGLGSSPKSEPVGKTDMLPAELIDRAMDILLPGRGYAVPRSTRSAIERVTPLLVAHGREQEREKWKARIERDLAAQRSIADSSSCESARQEATYCAGHLRSLLTEEEA